MLWDPTGEKEPSMEVYRKANSLLEEGRITFEGFNATFNADGTEEYVVIIGVENKYYCTCPSTTTCSHVLAARELLKKEMAL